MVRRGIDLGVCAALVSAATMACGVETGALDEGRGPGAAAATRSVGPGRVTADPRVDEPPTNPFLADSPWPMCHRGPYNQASSPLPGPDGSASLATQYLPTIPTSITLAWGPIYDDGSRPMWGATVANVFKVLDGGGPLETVDTASKEITPASVISGAYTLVDREGIFYVPQGTFIAAYGDRRAGVPTSRIAELRTYHLPADLLGDEDDEAIVGLNLTWDGYLLIVTRYGLVGAISRDFTEARFLQLGEGEVVSNSIASDESGGVYIVTSKKMHRLQWTGRELSLDPATGAWSADYETGGDPQGGRLGAGSGSTPTLMGVGDGDRFVVITDGQDLMHLVLFWRDEIPADWQPIAPGRDRRIAAEVPVTFGDPSATSSVSEQSVVVRGYGAVVVNNDYAFNVVDAIDGPIGNIITILISGLPGNAPYGVEKFEWDPERRALSTAWVNREISCPNGVPAMSAPAGLLYCVGQRGGAWTLEALDWQSGASAFHHPLGSEARFNSFYAAAEVGPWGGIASGTFVGLVNVAPGAERRGGGM